MQITKDNIIQYCPEHTIYNSLLALNGKKIIELGCGSATLTRAIASKSTDRQIIAFEVDEIQHEKNLQINDLPNVDFKLAGAENIPEASESADIVMMFKSLHHVPVKSMSDSMHEIKRVLKPGGYLYISEPVFDGEFNEVLRLFNNEKRVREMAFYSIKKAVDAKLFNLVSQTFFNAPVFFQDFKEFDEGLINSTHSANQLTPERHQQIKDLFLQNQQDDGVHFTMPIRVDLLRK